MVTYGYENRFTFSVRQALCSNMIYISPYIATVLERLAKTIYHGLEL